MQGNVTALWTIERLAPEAHYNGMSHTAVYPDAPGIGSTGGAAMSVSLRLKRDNVEFPGFCGDELIISRYGPSSIAPG